MFGFEKAGQGFSGNAGKDPVQRLDDGDLLAQFGQHGCRLQTDIAAADDHDLLDRGQGRHDLVDVGAGPDGVDIPRLVAGTVEHAR